MHAHGVLFRLQLAVHTIFKSFTVILELTVDLITSQISKTHSPSVSCKSWNDISVNLFVETDIT